MATKNARLSGEISICGQCLHRRVAMTTSRQRHNSKQVRPYTIHCIMDHTHAQTPCYIHVYVCIYVYVYIYMCIYVYIFNYAIATVYTDITDGECRAIYGDWCKLL